MAKTVTRVLAQLVLLLDRYHYINKAVLKATGSISTFRSEIWNALNRCDLESLNVTFRQARTVVETGNAVKLLAECKKYLTNNWDEIEAWQRYSEQLIGCSAEGLVG